jgi:hypothetical protein
MAEATIKNDPPSSDKWFTPLGVTWSVGVWRSDQVSDS